MSERACDDCEEVAPAGCRRRRCFHCGLLVCGWCMGHVHGCGPSHRRADCWDLARYRRARNKRQYLRRLRARTLVAPGEAHRA